MPYLFADAGLVPEWGRRLTAVEGFKIGISWQGDPKHRKNRFRSIRLAELEPLARLEGVRLFSLQKGPGMKELSAVAFPITDLGSQLDETTGAFMDTAAVIKHLDLVIAVDSAVAHCAGASAPNLDAFAPGSGLSLDAATRRHPVVPDDAAFPSATVGRVG